MIIETIKLKNITGNYLIDNSLEIDKNIYENTEIRDLKDIHFTGKIKKNYEDNYDLIGVLSGTMIIPDDITLEDYYHDFSIDIEEEIDKNIINSQKTLDILDFLWQNIVVEIPLKVVNAKNRHLNLKGKGWKLISEDELNTNNNPFSDLEKLLKDKEGE